MRRWTRWQDWVALAAGLYALLSPLWTTTVTKEFRTLLVLGILIGLAALWALAWPGMAVAVGVVAVLGALLFISPWVLSFAGMTAVAWTAWVTGGVALIMGVWALPLAAKWPRTHRGVAASH